MLERERDITEDPKAVHHAADAVRILYDLELGDNMPLIRHEVELVQFHTSSFVNTAYHSVDMCNNILQQAVPAGIVQMQPALRGDIPALNTRLTQY